MPPDSHADTARLIDVAEPRPAEAGGSAAAAIKLVVVGGGFTGAVLVLNAIRTTSRPLDVVVVEPGADLGRGIAYGTDDPAHRINVPSDRMGLFDGDPSGATRWFYDHGILPDAGSDDGQGRSYVAREAYGAFVADTLMRRLAAVADRVAFRHLRASARTVTPSGPGWQVGLLDGTRVHADIVALCFGHAVPSLPCPIDAAARHHPKFVPDPWARHRFDAIEPDDAVLIVGTGLTMADVAVSLREKQHRGPITAVSRRGLLPRPHGAFRGDIDILEGEPVPATALDLLRLLRRRIRASGPSLGGWHPLVDALRFKLPQIWGTLPRHEKVQVLRRLLSFWEVHRFRIAPQVAAALESSRESGALKVERAALAGLARDAQRFVATLRRPGGLLEHRAFDAVILCTGPEKSLRGNPLVAMLLAEGTARLDEVEVGLAVDPQSHVLDRGGRAWPTLLAFGPMTRGSFGEMTGAPDIARHIEALSAHLFDGVTAMDAVAAVAAASEANAV